jgi:hypothetical protein
MLKGSAEVNGVPSLQPPTDQVFTGKVVFNLVEGKGDAEGAVEPSAPKAGAAAPAEKPAAGEIPAAAAAGEKPAAAEGAAPAAAEAKPDAKVEEKPVEVKKKGPGEIGVRVGPYGLR